MTDVKNCAGPEERLKLMRRCGSGAQAMGGAEQQLVQLPVRPVCLGLLLIADETL